MTDPLTCLAVQYGTDKFGPHNYTPRYHALLAHLQKTPLRMLEIGVGGYNDPKVGGASLQVWRDYFAQGQIIGMDIAEKMLELGPRIVIERGSQVDPDFLAQILAEHGPFDIILDDGSHVNEHVVQTYELLFKTLRPGGFYIIEDVQTAFFPDFGGSLDLAEPNSVAYFARIMAGLVEDRADLADIAQMWRFHNIIALQKTGPDPLTQPVPAQGVSVQDTQLAALTRKFATMQDLDHLRVDGVPERLPERFAELDHREIRVAYPDADIPDLAREIAAIHAIRGAVTFEKGRNDYPSNFDFDPMQPEAKAALSTYKTLLEETPSERGLQVYGRLAVKSGWKDGMIFAADGLERIEAPTPPSLKLILKVAAKIGDDALYRRVLTRALSLYPHETEFVTRMADQLMSDSDPEAARTILLEARAAGVADHEIHLKLSKLHLKLDEFDQALSEAESATRLKPLKTPGWHHLIRAHMALRQLDKAEAACHKALDLCGEHVLLLVSLTTIHIRRGDLDRAKDVLIRAEQTAPTHPQVRRLKARLDAA